MAINLDPKITNITWFGGNTKVIDFTGISNDPIKMLTLLNQKLDLVVREWDYWDIYKFESSINDVNDIDTAEASLTPNHALVVNVDIPGQANTGNSTGRRDSYSRGDVILKKENGDTVHIKTKATGIFYPSELVAGSAGTYSLKYKYAATLADLPTGTGSGISFDPDNNYQSTTIDLVGASSTNYAVLSLVSSSDLQFAKLTNINPVIKFFLVSGNTNEEVITGYDLTETSSNYTVHCADLMDYAAINNIYMVVK